MKRRIIQPKTCFALGIAGAVCSLAAGVLMAFGLGAAFFLRNAAMALTGAMLLFLASCEKGKDKAARRTKLLLLFFALLFSFFNLPLLCPPLEAIVIPLLALMYRQKEDVPAIVTLSAVETAYVVVRTVAITGAFGPLIVSGTGAVLGAAPTQVEGFVLVLVAIARGWVLIRLYLAARKLAPLERDNAGTKLG